MNKIRLPRDGAEYAYFTFSPASPPLGAELEVQVNGAWYGIDSSGGTAKLLLRGPDAPAGSGVTVAEDSPLRVRVKNAPEIIVRGAGSVVLVG